MKRWACGSFTYQTHRICDLFDCDDESEIHAYRYPVVNCDGEVIREPFKGRLAVLFNWEDSRYSPVFVDGCDV